MEQRVAPPGRNLTSSERPLKPHATILVLCMGLDSYLCLAGMQQPDGFVMRYEGKIGGGRIRRFSGLQSSGFQAGRSSVSAVLRFGRIKKCFWSGGTDRLVRLLRDATVSPCA